MLKHISTLNVATLVLLLALVRDFYSKAKIQAEPLNSTQLSLLFFSGSLVLTIIGLFLHVAWGRNGGKPVRILTVVAYASFLCGLVTAIVFVP
jgi:hypothetical protein